MARGSMKKFRSRGEKTAEFDLNEMPGPLLRRCNQRSRAIYEAHLGSAGLTREQVAVLIAVKRAPGAPHMRLIELTGMDRNSLAGVVDRLVDKHLVERQRAARDGRAYEVNLTAAGARLIEVLEPAIDRVQNEILALLPAELRTVFVQCLRIVAGVE